MSLDEVLKKVLQKLEIEASGAHIEVQALSQLLGDSDGLTLLFQNLIGNALKYIEPGCVPIIKVESKPIEKCIHVIVSDNDIGIPENKATEIFQPFTRLHTSHDYSGTGIGLSTCAKIGELHNGRIKVKPHPDKGSQFCLTIQN